MIMELNRTGREMNEARNITTRKQGGARINSRGTSSGCNFSKAQFFLALSYLFHRI